MTEKRFEIDSRMYGATDIRYYLKDNANELVDGYGDEIYWGDGSSNGLKQIVNKLNELHEEKEIAINKDNAITYKELDKIVIEVMEGYLNMLQAGNMSFSEFAILENVLLKLNEGINKKKRSKDNGKK